MDAPRPPRVTGTRVVYENRWMRLREDRFERADGSEGLYAVVEKSPATAVIAIDGEEVVLVEQYRHPVGERFWELPQGAWDGDDQPDPEEEGLRVGRFSLERAEEMILDGTIADAATVAAFGLLRLKRPELVPASQGGSGRVDPGMSRP